MTPTTVLICDDALFMRTMLRGILGAAGCEVVGEAENGRAAVEMFIRLRPDVVFMDMVMPLMGGVDALREIRTFDPNAHVIMCSAMGQKALVDESLEAGARGFISKPFTAARVMETLNDLGMVMP